MDLARTSVPSDVDGTATTVDTGVHPRAPEERRAEARLPHRPAVLDDARRAPTGR